MCTKKPRKRHHTRFFTLNHYFLLFNPPFHPLPLNRIRSKTIRTVLLRIPTCVPNLKLLAQLLQKLSREITDRPTDRQTDRPTDRPTEFFFWSNQFFFTFWDILSRFSQSKTNVFKSSGLLFKMVKLCKQTFPNILLSHHEVMGSRYSIGQKSSKKFFQLNRSKMAQNVKKN